jgi:hypothetical protein
MIGCVMRRAAALLSVLEHCPVEEMIGCVMRRSSVAQRAGTLPCRGSHALTSLKPPTPKSPNKNLALWRLPSCRRNDWMRDAAQQRCSACWNTALSRQSRPDVSQTANTKIPQQKFGVVAFAKLSKK